jgi:hypothetical protein
MKTKMNLLSHELLTALLTNAVPPCLSLYLPTHRHHPDNQQDPIRFRNLVKELEQSLCQKYAATEAGSFLAPFEALAGDSEFWNHTLDGVAVFGGSGGLRVIGLQRTVEPLAIVADSFHTKPLRRFLQTADHYQVLALSLDRIRLFEGNRDALDEIALAPGVPRTLTEALGEELTEPHQTVASYGGTGGGSHAMSHGHGGAKDEADIDTDRFFRAVDRAVREHHSQRSGLPLVLAALPEHHGLFRRISHNPFLLADGIKGDPRALSLDHLRERAWQIMEPEDCARLTKLSDEFGHARAVHLALDDLDAVAEAANEGRIGTLLIEADRQIAGRLHADNGRIQYQALAHPDTDDLLDDLGELVFKKGGRVAVMSAERMPTQTGVAATCRY